MKLVFTLWWKSVIEEHSQNTLWGEFHNFSAGTKKVLYWLAILLISHSGGGGIQSRASKDLL